MSYKAIAANTAYQILARTVTSFMGFLITVIIAREFGLSGYGDFIKVTSFVAFFYLFSDFGLNAIFLQDEKNKFKDIFTTRLFMGAIIFIVCNLIALVLPYSKTMDIGFSNSLKILIFIFSFSIFLQSIGYSAAYYFQKKLDYFKYMIGTISGSLLSLTLVFIFTFLNFSISYLFVSLLFGSLLSCLVLLFFVKEKIFEINFNFSLYKELIIKSTPLGLMLVFNFIYFRIDIILLSVLSSTSAVGIYGLSYKFFDFLIAIPLFLSNSIYPLLLKAKDDGKRFSDLIIKYFFVFLVLSILIGIPFWFASPLFNLIKPEFIKSIIPFRILILSLPFFFLTSFLQWILITLKKQKYLMSVYFFSTALNILLNIIFIPKFSYLAAAYITVFSEFVVFIFLVGKLFLERKKIYA